MSTHRSPGRLSHRASGLPLNLTFADAAEKVRDGNISHSQAAVTDLGMVPAERLHPNERTHAADPLLSFVAST